MKYHSPLFSIHRLQSNRFTASLYDCTQRNPNKITNLTPITLTQTEISVLELGLKHGVLLRPKESKMIAIVENVWEKNR